MSERTVRMIERAKVYALHDNEGEVNLGEVIEVQRAALEATSRLFRDVMPRLKAKDEALDADALVLWQEVEDSVARALQRL